MNARSVLPAAAIVAGVVALAGVAPAGEAALSLDTWHHVQIDANRCCQVMGLAAGDLTGDGFADIATGPYFYRNPGGTMTGAWDRVPLAAAISHLDAMVITDVDSDGRGDIIASANPPVYWLEAVDAAGSAWEAVKIGDLPKTGHSNGQGYRAAQIIAGGREEILLTVSDGLYCFAVPTSPEAGNWPMIRITTDGGEHGVGVGDIDGDGDIDVVARKRSDAKTLGWYRNPGDGSSDWPRYPVGAAARAVDFNEVADVNGDGRPDVVAAEFTLGSDANHGLYWFEHPGTLGSQDWTRHEIGRATTFHSLKVADIDGDGDVDIVTGNHRYDMKILIWENGAAGGSWKQHLVEKGEDSHLGGVLVDLEGDGDLDIVNHGWDNYKELHVYINGAMDATEVLASPPAHHTGVAPRMRPVTRRRNQHAGIDMLGRTLSGPRGASTVSPMAPLPPKL